METLVFFMQVVSIAIVAAGAYLCLVHAGILPEMRRVRAFAIAASCVLFGAALWAFALSLTMQPAPVEAAERDEPALPVVSSTFVAAPPAAASTGGDGSFEVYEYH